MSPWPNIRQSTKHTFWSLSSDIIWFLFISITKIQLNQNNYNRRAIIMYQQKFSVRLMYVNSLLSYIYTLISYQSHPNGYRREFEWMAFQTEKKKLFTFETIHSYLWRLIRLTLEWLTSQQWTSRRISCSVFFCYWQF